MKTRKIIDFLEIDILTKEEKEAIRFSSLITYILDSTEPMKKLKLDCFHSSDIFSRFGNLKALDTNIKSFEKITSSFSQLVDENQIQTQLDITKVDSFAVSKSAAKYSYPDIYSFGKDIFENRKDEWTLEECLADFNLQNKKNEYSKNMRNNRIIWSNSDGSHHFAVAIYHLINSGSSHFIDANICERSINKDVAKSIIDEYEVFILNKDDLLNEVLKHLENFNYGLFSFDRNGECNEFCLVVTKESSHPIINFLLKFDKKHILYLNELLIKYIN